MILKFRSPKKIFNEPQYFIFSALWLIIMLPKVIQMICFMIIALLLCKKRGFKLKFDGVAVAMICIFITQVFAILYNVIMIQGDTTRVPAAINTSLLWLVAAIFYLIFSDFKSLNIIKIGKYCCFNLFVLSVWALITIYLYYFRGYSQYSVWGNMLFTTTYLAGHPTTKFMGLNDFSNMNLIYIMLMMALAIPYIKTKRKIYQLLIILIASISVIIINSRSGFVLFGISMIYCYFELVPKKYKKILIVLAITLGIITIMFLLRQIWQIFMSEIIMGNESSNNFRILLLRTSIEEAWSKSPVWGMGIKRYLIEGYPLGSHSTYIGFFYKTGFIGIIMGIYVFAKTNIRVFKCVKNNNYIKTILFFLISFITLFGIEDVDGANWCIILYFSSLAFLPHLNNQGD